MKFKVILGSLCIALFFCGKQVLAADYKIDIAGQHAFITFKAKHLGYSYVVGGFNQFEGSFSYDAENPGASKAEVIIDASSIDTNHAERDKHLRSDDFFKTGKYSQITFESTGYISGADGDKLRGNLTMLGVTRAIEIDLRQIGEGKDPWGGYRSGFQGSVTLDAPDFGMPQWVGAIEVELNIEGVRI